MDENNNPDPAQVWAKKSPEMKTLLNAITPYDPKDGVCPLCGAKIEGFRDEISKREYAISGMCQGCQDRVFSPEPGDDEEDVYQEDDWYDWEVAG